MRPLPCRAAARARAGKALWQIISQQSLVPEADRRGVPAHMTGPHSLRAGIGERWRRGRCGGAARMQTQRRAARPEHRVTDPGRSCRWRSAEASIGSSSDLMLPLVGNPFSGRALWRFAVSGAWCSAPRPTTTAAATPGRRMPIASSDLIGALNPRLRSLPARLSFSKCVPRGR